MFAREGYPFIISTALLFIIILIFPKCILVTLSILLVALMFWFFRDPERVTDYNGKSICSAADGKIVEISEVKIDGASYRKISVFMNLFSVHVNRAPCSGVIDKIEHIKGTFINADKPEASAQNERNKIHIQSEYGRIICVQVAGLIARRTVTYVEEGNNISKGDRIGMIKFSSRVDHYIPMDASVSVYIGQKVKAGISTIAEFE